MGRNKCVKVDSAILYTEHATKISLAIGINKDEKKCKCTYADCNAVFLRPSRLARHMRMHTGERPYKCNQPGCHKAYTNTSHLKRHSATHSIVKTTYKCGVCSLVISNQHNLKRHYLRVHNEERKLFCNECNAMFTKKHQLATHIASHSPIQHECEKCHKTYANLRQYTKHIRMHNATRKTYLCTVPECKEVFNRWALLSTHLKTQHVIEYKCLNCSKIFLNKAQLKMHSRIHSENRNVIPCPYEYCHRMYFYKSNLDHHIRTKHCGQKYICDICGAKLSSKQKVERHIINMHLSTKKKKKTVKRVRAKRKDAGIPKKSALTALVGLSLPVQVEKKILQRKSDIKCLPISPLGNSDND